MLFRSLPSAAWDQALKGFKESSNPNSLPIDAWLSNAFYSAVIPRCAILDGSTQCDMQDCKSYLQTRWCFDNGLASGLARSESLYSRHGPHNTPSEDLTLIPISFSDGDCP